MKSSTSLLLILTGLLTVACDRIQQAPAGRNEQASLKEQANQENSDRQATGRGPMQQVSLNQAQQSQSIAEAMNRKILRNADLTLEVANPAVAQSKISSIAESLGGFVVLSESKQRQASDSGAQDLQVNLVVRIPAAQFDAALNEIRAQATRVIQNKTTGEDVTEEFIDLEARIKTQKALELQFLEIMKQATKVSDALEVQRQIAEVRTEIEKLEGRKRFLENRANLSTFNITLQTPTVIVVSTSSFGRNVKDAVADSITVAGAIVLFLVRFVILLIPILILIIIPGGLLTRFVFRRAKRFQFSPESRSSPDSN
jgi:Domain of unknown function (DUF4349)